MSTNFIGPLHMKQMGILPSIVKQRLNVKHGSCNIQLPPEPVCGIREHNEGNLCCNIQSINLLALSYSVLKWGAVYVHFT